MYHEAKSKVIQIVNTLNYLQANPEGLKPVQLGNAREYAISIGLGMIAESFNVSLRDVVRIDANGEVNFFLNPGQTFGEDLAALLSEHYTRTGIQAHKGYVMPYHSWVMINHFEAEKFIRTVAKYLDNETQTV